MTAHAYKHPDVAGFDLPLPCAICDRERRDHTDRTATYEEVPSDD